MSSALDPEAVASAATATWPRWRDLAGARALPRERARAPRGVARNGVRRVGATAVMAFLGDVRCVLGWGGVRETAPVEEILWLSATLPSAISCERNRIFARHCSIAPRTRAARDMASTSSLRPVITTASVDRRGVVPRPARITAAPKLVGALASIALVAAQQPTALAEGDDVGAGGGDRGSDGGGAVAKAVTATPLECANDPSCAAERSDLLAAGAYAPGVDVVGDVDDDPDAAVRRAICPRNPTADVCRSMKDRKKVNDSKCRIPVGLGCAMWK